LRSRLNPLTKFTRAAIALARLGDQKAALTNIQAGMNGIYNWLNYLNENFRFEFGQDWDPGGTIRAGIKTDLAMISSGKIDWPKLIADRERLGIAVEQEEDNFRVQNLDGSDSALNNMQRYARQFDGALS
jgi:hypothetical protein